MGAAGHNGPAAQHFSARAQLFARARARQQLNTARAASCFKINHTPPARAPILQRIRLPASAFKRPKSASASAVTPDYAPGQRAARANALPAGPRETCERAAPHQSRHLLMFWAPLGLCLPLARWPG